MVLRLQRALVLALVLIGIGSAGATSRADTAGEPGLTVRLAAQVELPGYRPVTLADVGTLSGALADEVAETVIGAAPAPGRRSAIARASLLAALERAGVPRDAVRLDGAARVQLSGTGQPLDAERVRRAVRAAIEAVLEDGALGAGVTARIGDVRVPRAVLIPPGAHEMEVETRRRALRSGVSGLTLIVRAPHAPPRRIPVQVTLEIEGLAVVAVREVARGTRVTERDVTMRRATWPRTGRLVASMENAIGRVARSRLAVGDPVTTGALGPALAVVRGQAVLARLRQGAVDLTLETTARGDGEVGSIVKVIGVDGRRVLDARVTGPGRVVVLGSDDIDEATPNEEAVR